MSILKMLIEICIPCRRIKIIIIIIGMYSTPLRINITISDIMTIILFIQIIYCTSFCFQIFLVNR